MTQRSSQVDEITAAERRRHVVYLTRNTEYHCRLEECVGVRDRRSGRWLRRHPAVRAALVGTLTPDRQRALPSGSVDAGARLCFRRGPRAVLTSPVRFVGRPDRFAVWHYSSQVWAGAIAPAMDGGARAVGAG